MEKDSEGTKSQPEEYQNNTADNQQKASEKTNDNDKSHIHKEIASEIKIANADGKLEGGDNKQWHMDQGEFNDQEKEDFENEDEKK